MRAIAFLISFTMAFLLFAVQPMATKMVLPTLGGTPAVWNTAMFTFQLLLLAGYGYAHGLARLPGRVQVLVHAFIILASFACLPLNVELASNEAVVTHPIRALVVAFTLQIGLPFFCLAATAPLLQSWVSRSAHPLAKTPYVLYSASNLGSFAGLLGYVGLVEPFLTLKQQTQGWSTLYITGTALLIYIGYRLYLTLPERAPTARAALPAKRQAIMWIALAFLPSSLSLGVTTYITTDVASVPLLWVIPLSLYLLSFVDAFRIRPRLVPLCQRVAPLLGMTALLLYGLQGHRLAVGFAFHLLTFAALALAIHGWLAMRKPAPQQLTGFYVCLSIGGALGGVLNGLVAPLVFREALEYPIVLLLTSVTGFILFQLSDDRTHSARDQWRSLLHVAMHILVVTAIAYGAFTLVMGEGDRDLARLNTQTLMMAASFAGLISLIRHRRYIQAFYACATVISIMLFAVHYGVVGYRIIFKDRNFFGVERIYYNEEKQAHFMMHDTTLHGVESLKPGEAMRSLSYYWGLRALFEHLPVMRTKPIGVVGLGIGSIKCFAQRHQQVDFYEINPMVKQLAEDSNYFHQLRDCPGDYHIYLGDGRIQLGARGDETYGALVLDAFSSDAIPAHLLTREAMQLYMSKLAPGGVLVIHTTNRHIDLWPLIGVQAEELGVVAYGKFMKTAPKQPLLFDSFWVVMARSRSELAPLIDTDHTWEPLHGEGNRPWTDQYSNILPYFKELR